MTNLRDSLLAALSKLPGTREFHLHVLNSVPKKTNALFPFSRPRPRTYVQEILVLLSEQENPDAPRIIVTAVEVSLFHIPSTSSAVLYVSKVDSTGQAKGKSPTATIVRALLNHYADPATRPVAADHLWIHLFARAQAQYLFPNSADYPGKQPLNDVKLCAWWKRLLSQVASELEPRLADLPDGKVKAFYVLPGYSELEAENTIRAATASIPPLLKSITWQYGHPYSQTDIPTPCPRDSADKGANLGNSIPYFDDDPKSRFLDEIAYIPSAEGVKSPVRKRSKTTSQEGGTSRNGAVTDSSTKDIKEGKLKDDKLLGELGKVTADEFWERMSFRQECVAGAVTGFFTLIVSSKSKDAPHSSISPLAPQPGQVASQINKRIMTSLLTGVEFSTLDRSIRATETLESAIKGLCEGISILPSQTGRPVVRKNSGRQTPEAEPSRKPRLLAPPSTPPRNKVELPEVSPNPFPEPVASLETYRSFIYGSVAVNNPVVASVPDVSNAENSQGAPHVTVLTVRRKKKRAN
ncbi:DUF1714 domain-containing protein [Coprinopsis marcescibilis]|uniref:histone acetyltransferase n=1 Tax=Coprinopsis marcescibilis TaxID=230819 RepID=A0A5C3LHM5_COPMA|nr:DUF1714 domain-containing protein [Coprinopsis marcescibilis]